MNLHESYYNEDVEPIYKTDEDSRSSKSEYEAYMDRKVANILTRLKSIEARVESIEKELKMNGEKKEILE
jgi:Mg2+ and Co2+ transporter CorA